MINELCMIILKAASELSQGLPHLNVYRGHRDLFRLLTLKYLRFFFKFLHYLIIIDEVY